MVFYGPASAITVLYGARGRDAKRGDISQKWDIWWEMTCKGRVLRNGVADSPFGVVLHAQLFTNLQFTYLLHMGPIFRVSSEGLWCVYYNFTQL